MRTLFTTRLLPAALPLLVALAGCGGGGGPNEVPANAVALVGDEPITRAAFASALAANRQSYRLKGQVFPAVGTADFTTARNKLLDQLVQQAELRAARPVAVRDRDRRRAGRARSWSSCGNARPAGSEARFREALAQQGLTEAQLRARIRNQLLGEDVFARLSAEASVSDDEVQRYYKSHLKGYERPATRRVSHILVHTRAQADELERKLRDGADFAALARRYSIDASTAASGGVLAGGIAQGQTLPAFDRVAFSLKTNAISPPVRTPSGWDIIEATSDVTPGTTTPLSDVRSTIEAALLTTKRQNALTQWVDATRAEYAEARRLRHGIRPPG